MSSKRALKDLIKCVSIIREQYQDMPATTLEVLLHVALEPGSSSTEIREAVSTSQSSISRHLSLLGDYNWRGEEGLRLIKLIENPTDRRQKIAFLTERGRAVMKQVLEVMAPKSSHEEHMRDADDYLQKVRGW
ncbi:MAG: MarR family winged helix-turn-helix transcriptional regulator [Paracoccaceae bacterium]